MMVEVRVVSVTRVSPSPSGATRPEPLRLSSFDTVWINLPPIQRLFLYRTDRPLPSVAEELKASLSRTLSRFYSLAGTFTHVPDSGDVVISFLGGGDDGVAFLEAEAEAEAEGFEFRRLAEDEDHDAEGFSSLVPPLDVEKLPAPVFSVQVTGFAGAGVAVGLSVHHMAVDGKALWQFVEAWAAECRSEGRNGPEPVLDRSVIIHPGVEEIARRIVSNFAPNLPTLSNPKMPISDRHLLSRRTFVVSAASIASLRERGTSGTARPSAFVAVSAHVWLTFLRAVGITPDDRTAILVFPVDCRRLHDPPVEDEYFGNCVWPCVAKAKASELLGDGEESFRTACGAVRVAVNERLRKPLGNTEDLIEMFPATIMMGTALVAGSPKFRVYTVDFGWGRPRRVELVSLNRDGMVALAAARDEEGGIQASVALSRLRMDSFASLFLDGL